MDEAASSLFGSLLHPYWRESEAHLTEKQAVLLMHDIYSSCIPHVLLLPFKLFLWASLPIDPLLKDNILVFLMLVSLLSVVDYHLS